MRAYLPHVRLATLLLVAIGFAGCRAPAPHPCRVDKGAVPPKPAWAGPEEWAVSSLPQPGNGWISSVAVKYDGSAGVYGGSIGGSFIPISEEVTLIYFKIGPKMEDLSPVVMTLPGIALRNYAAMSWAPHGLAFGSRSTLGVSDPESGSVKRLRELEIGDQKKLNSIPTHNAVVWAPGGDCVAATVPLETGTGELVTWNAAGARDASSRHEVDFLEKANAWTDEGILLVWSSGASPARARWMDPATGVAKEAPAPPADAQAFSWVGGGWLTVDRIGTVMHRIPGEPATLVTSVTPALELLPNERRRWLRVLASDNGRALLVEESVVAPKKDLRHMHVLTPRAP